MACVIHESLNANRQSFCESKFRQTSNRWAAYALCSAVVLWHQLTATAEITGHVNLRWMSCWTQMVGLGFSKEYSKELGSPRLLSGAEREEQFGKEKTQYLLGRGRAPWFCCSWSQNAGPALLLQPRLVAVVVDSLPLKSWEMLRAKTGFQRLAWGMEENFLHKVEMSK